MAAGCFCYTPQETRHYLALWTFCAPLPCHVHQGERAFQIGCCCRRALCESVPDFFRPGDGEQNTSLVKGHHALFFFFEGVCASFLSPVHSNCTPPSPFRTQPVRTQKLRRNYHRHAYIGLAKRSADRGLDYNSSTAVPHHATGCTARRHSPQHTRRQRDPPTSLNRWTEPLIRRRSPISHGPASQTGKLKTTRNHGGSYIAYWTNQEPVRGVPSQAKKTGTNQPAIEPPPCTRSSVLHHPNLPSSSVNSRMDRRHQYRTGGP